MRPSSLSPGSSVLLKEFIRKTWQNANPIIFKSASTLLCCIAFFGLIPAQQEKLEIDGAIQIANSEDPTPDPGTIRWTGIDFEGWNGQSWISLSSGKTGPVSDIDGHVYSTIKIGTQTWMAQNLRTSKYRNGVSIPNVVSNTRLVIPTKWCLLLV